MADIYITSKKLAEVLGITDDELIKIEKEFDKDPEDKWDLKPEKDYRIVCQSTKLREYKPSGAYAIAEYWEHKQKSEEKGLLGLIKKFIRKLKGDVRKSFVSQKILNNCSSLVKRNRQFFISESDAISIFGTRKDYFRKMFECAQLDDKTVLLKDDHYADFIDEKERYFSLEGIYRLSLVFHQNISSKNRKDWCKDAGEIIEKQVDDIVGQILRREKQVEAVKKEVKKRDKQTCQVTGAGKNKINKLRLAAHHLYSQNEYPHLADVKENLITLSEDIHDEFHCEYMGGTSKPCTIDDFIQFVQKYYPHNTEVLNRLEHQKLRLGTQQPIDKRTAHVLYLPYSRFLDDSTVKL